MMKKKELLNCFNNNEGWNSFEGAEEQNKILEKLAND